MSSFLRFVLHIIIFFGLKRMHATTSLCLLYMSTLRIVRTSVRKLKKFSLISTWSIWFCVIPSDDCQVYLWMFLCGNRVSPIKSWLAEDLCRSQSIVRRCYYIHPQTHEGLLF